LEVSERAKAPTDSNWLAAIKDEKDEKNKKDALKSLILSHSLTHTQTRSFTPVPINLLANQFNDCPLSLTPSQSTLHPLLCFASTHHSLSFSYHLLYFF
jgi:hypothetical protein